MHCDMHEWLKRMRGGRKGRMHGSGAISSVGESRVLHECHILNARDCKEGNCTLLCEYKLFILNVVKVHGFQCQHIHILSCSAGSTCTFY